MASPPPNKAPGLPNPYAKSILPNPYAATVSAPPVVYTEEQQKKAPAFHNPHSIKRPQPKKPNPVVKRPTIPKAAMASLASASSSGPALDPSSGPSDPSSSGPEPVATKPATSPQQHGIDYYRSTADDDAAILEERRMRLYEEKQRKKEQKKFTKLFGSWNPQAPYKASRWSNLRAYRASGGQQRRMEDFKAFLQVAAERYRALHPDEVSHSTSRADSRAAQSTPAAAVANPLFAPPATYGDDSVISSSNQTGEDAYARRVRLSGSQVNSALSPSAHEPAQEPTQELNQELAQKPVPIPPSVTNDHTTPPPPPPPPAASAPTSSSHQGVTVSAPPERYAHATISAPPERYAHAVISAPPVRYDRPDVPTRVAENEPDLEERPSKRPKISKAEAMMAKMGYVKGQGLGKNNDGVLTHLEVKMRKGQQGASTLDGEDNKVKSSQVWDVSGAVRQKEEPGKFGEESSVVVTWGCVDGVDWDANADRNDGGIRQDMGEAFSAKFGPVEQIMLDEGNKDGTVYIRFQSILAALNAVNRFDEGWEFRGRKIRAHYYDERKFAAGIYDY